MAATVVLSSDLMIASQISGAAARHGAEVRTVSSAEQLLDETDTARVILDLSLPGLDVAGIVARLRAAAAPPPQIIAFGPHVHEAKLAAAREAGCDEVLSRGGLHSRLDEFFAAGDANDSASSG